MENSTPEISPKKLKGKMFVTPDQVRPVPKSEKRKPNSKGRKKGRTFVLTETPKKNKIEQKFQ